MHWNNVTFPFPYSWRVKSQEGIKMENREKSSFFSPVALYVQLQWDHGFPLLSCEIDLELAEEFFGNFWR